MFYMQRLKDLRQDRDLTQREVARFLCISQQQYSTYERGTRTLPVEHLILLADFYQTSMDYITGRTNKTEPYPKAKGLNQKNDS